jgi:membrane-bound metal-dependent hydrolase YbcI (DUF457 family)
MLIVSGLAPDLDYASYFGGAGTFMRFHRTLLHSLAGAAVAACVIAAIFCVLDGKTPRKKTARATAPVPLGFGVALAVCAIGVAGHLLLDLLSGIGLQLFWPVRAHWYGWDLASNLDPWILVLLIVGLLLPLLFKLVNEEVTSGAKDASGNRAAVITLMLLAAYFGVRAHLHSEAVDLLLSREYHGRIPLSGAAFPKPFTPFIWRGVVVTDNTLEDVDVPVGKGDEFDANSSITQYKPEESPALETGEKTEAATAFLAYARLPIASVQRNEDDYRIEIRDARFAFDDDSPSNIFVRIDLNSNLQIRSQSFVFASSPNP